MDEQRIDATTFQKPLKSLAETLAQKAKREAPVDGIVREDLHLLVRQAMWTYDLLFYLNADERRETDCYWRDGYTIVTLPLVRNMIDCLFNISFILQDPGHNGVWFRESGFMKMLQALKENEALYGEKPEWDAWIADSRKSLEEGVRVSKLKMADIPQAKSWPTLGMYTSAMKGKGAKLTPHQQFFQNFLYGHWHQYSAMAHATFEGLLLTGLYYMEDSVPHEFRPKLEEAHPKYVSTHLGRAAIVLLCIATELQAKFRFDGANINERIRTMWDILLPTFDARELYAERYEQLMKDRGIIV